MPISQKSQKINFSRSKILSKYPDFLEIQLKAFQDFFQLETTPENRKNEGLFKVFSENFPITDARNNFVLEFIDYFIDPPRYSVEECIERGLTYSVPLKAKLKLYCTDPDHEDFETIIQDVYLGTIPYMTPKGTFVINGAERVIVSQLHRSPGVFFGTSKHPNGTQLYSARIIPFKGAWVEFTTDINNVMYAYIDRKKKLPVTTLLRAIGYQTDKEILQIFDLAEEVPVNKTSLKKVIDKKLAARVLRTWIEDFVDEDTGEVVSIERTEIVIDREVILDEKNIQLIIDSGAPSILVHRDDVNPVDFAIISNTLQKDTANSQKEAVEFIYRLLRNADPPDEETARSLIDRLFFSDKRYDLGDVGRFRINKRLYPEESDKSDKSEQSSGFLPPDSNIKVLTNQDIVLIIKNLIQLVNSKADVDDIDHLSNRRIRTVGEQLHSQFGVGLSRMARTIRERMNVRDNEVFTPADLINAKTLASVINSFFGTSQLSQFMDQTNPLAELTHKRRISALGPGGLSRERAGFEVRDVHYTHYGRLCTIETPEGPNIGLISSLCVYAKINNLGFIETPYKKVTNGKVDMDIDPVYLSAEEEEKMIIAQANTPIDDEGNFISPASLAQPTIPGKKSSKSDLPAGRQSKSDKSAIKINARHYADYPVVEPGQLNYIDVAPNQIASIAASLIPFLEHDDANRALMGSNMMRQAVPLLKPDFPIVGTGIETDVVRDSRVLISAEGDGVVEYVDAREIVIRYSRSDKEKLVSFEDDVKSYKLTKFARTNQNTCINLVPIVKLGEKVKKGQPVCDGYATRLGELALGRNLKVAFMPWKGNNFEDAIVLSEKVLKDDIFTSIHVEEYTLEVRDTKRGIEELTNDIPNVSADMTKNLDENGLIRIGAEVHEGDILIGKITPKGETDPTPEEKLLRAIFGDKAGDVKDASLKAPPSLEGIVIDKKLFSRAVKDRKNKPKEKVLLDKIEEEFNKNHQALKDRLIDKLLTLVSGKTSQGVYDNFKQPLIPKGTRFTQKVLASINYELLTFFKWTTDKDKNQLIKILLHNYNIKLKEILGVYNRKKFALAVGDDLPAGIVQLAKVYVAKKRKLKVGDKLAGRHGNKGIVAKIVREEDMPFLSDGSRVDLVLNPLGVPSRMNLGQIYETVLAWAGDELGKKAAFANKSDKSDKFDYHHEPLRFSTPIFDGASLEQINEYLLKAQLPENGAVFLRDGETGELFDQAVTVGIIYMLKLHHMVDDKMHARSIGPYSLITQQPLGGKAQFGGQRFGEMEMWALEAFGASSILQEVDTVKSDDVIGRAKTYEAIVKGENMPQPGIPESFNVLVHELNGLGLKITFEQ